VIVNGVTLSETQADWYGELFLRALTHTHNLDEAMKAADLAFSLQPEEDIDLSWSPYRGPHGGVGWRSSKTGEVRYQQQKPTEYDESHPVYEPAPQKAGQSQPAPSQKTSQQPQPPTPQKTQQPQQAQSAQGQPPIKPPANQGQILSQVSHAAHDRDLNDAMRELSGVNLKQNAPVPVDVAAQFDAHGVDTLSSLTKLLNGGIDPNREFFSSPLSGVYAEAGGYGTTVRDNSNFVVLGHPGKTLKEGGIAGVLVDPLHEPFVQQLNQAFPGIKFVAARQAPQILPKVAGNYRGGIKYPSINASFSLDIFDKKAQAVLNLAMGAAKQISAQARRDLEAALKTSSPAEAASRVVAFVSRYRQKLAGLLSSTQLAALLEGARGVALIVPKLLSLGGVNVRLPPSLPPEEAGPLLEKIESLEGMRREEAIYQLPAEQQQFVRNVIASRGAEPPAPPTLTAPPAGTPERIQFPIIEAAVEDLAERNVLDRDSFDRLDAAARQKAFTVSGVDAQETLTKIRDALAENVAKGADFETFKEEILASVGSGTFLSDTHLETVFRANVSAAFSEGQLDVLRQPLIRSGFPYAAYDSIRDDRTRENHLHLETLGIDGGNIYRIDDPVFRQFRPPWDYNCRCSWTPMSVKFAAERGVAEAQRWLDTGVEPSPPAFVAAPPFSPPPGFEREVASMPLSVRMSMESMDLDEQETFAEAAPEQGGAAPWVDGAPKPKPAKVKKKAGRHRRKGKHRVSRKSLRFGRGRRIDLSLQDVSLAAADWAPHRTRTGSPAWKNVHTGQIRYQRNRPGDRGTAREEGGERRPSPQDQPTSPTSPTGTPAPPAAHSAVRVHKDSLGRRICYAGNGRVACPRPGSGPPLPPPTERPTAEAMTAVIRQSLQEGLTENKVAGITTLLGHMKVVDLQKLRKDLGAGWRSNKEALIGSIKQQVLQSQLTTPKKEGETAEQPLLPAPAPAPAPVTPTSTPIPPLRQPQNVTVDWQGDSRRLVEELFGDRLKEGVFEAMCNAVDGSKVTVRAGYNGKIETVSESPGGGVYATRTFRRHSDGKIVVHNDYQKIRDRLADGSPNPWKGKGFEVFTNQVNGLRAAGVSRIETSACGSKEGAAAGGLNGYYTWPRLGFGGSMRETFNRLPENFRSQLGRSRDVRDLFDLPGGAEAWKEYGNSFEAKFDLRDGSRNMKALQAYVAERSSRSAQREVHQRQDASILGEMRRLDPSVASGATVLLRDLRRNAPPQYRDKAAFDAAILRLAEEGQVVLHRHDHPSLLTPAQRDELVYDPESGNYFTSIGHRV
jgi:SPP1 gp7 family putative phage head morphogenesis protein